MSSRNRPSSLNVLACCSRSAQPPCRLLPNVGLRCFCFLLEQHGIRVWMLSTPRLTVIYIVFPLTDQLTLLTENNRCCCRNNPLFINIGLCGNGPRVVSYLPLRQIFHRVHATSLFDPRKTRMKMIPETLCDKRVLKTRNLEVCIPFLGCVNKID